MINLLTVLIALRRLGMNIKKSSLLLGIVPLLLSCSGNSPYGEYLFQMGKSKDTHMGVSLKLTKDDYDENDKDKGKKFELRIDLSSTESDNDFTAILAAVTPITGYYKIDKTKKVYKETRLDVGLTLLGEYEIPQEITNLLFVASLTASTVNFYLPVSLDDLEFQLYWCGFDTNLASIFDDESESEDPFVSPDGVHDIDVHPTQEQINAINEHYPDQHNGKTFRDYHVLKLGLTKQ